MSQFVFSLLGVFFFLKCFFAQDQNGTLILSLKFNSSQNQFWFSKLPQLQIISFTNFGSNTTITHYQYSSKQQKLLKSYSNESISFVQTYRRDSKSDICGFFLGQNNYAQLLINKNLIFSPSLAIYLGNISFNNILNNSFIAQGCQRFLYNNSLFRTVNSKKLIVQSLNKLPPTISFYSSDLRFLISNHLLYYIDSYLQHKQIYNLQQWSDYKIWNWQDERVIVLAWNASSSFSFFEVYVFKFTSTKTSLLYSQKGSFVDLPNPSASPYLTKWIMCYIDASTRLNTQIILSINYYTLEVRNVQPISPNHLWSLCSSYKENQLIMSQKHIYVKNDNIGYEGCYRLCLDSLQQICYNPLSSVNKWLNSWLDAKTTKIMTVLHAYKTTEGIEIVKYSFGQLPLNYPSISPILTISQGTFQFLAANDTFQWTDVSYDGTQQYPTLLTSIYYSDSNYVSQTIALQYGMLRVNQQSCKVFQIQLNPQVAYQQQSTGYLQVIIKNQSNSYNILSNISMLSNINLGVTYAASLKCQIVQQDNSFYVYSQLSRNYTPILFIPDSISPSIANSQIFAIGDDYNLTYVFFDFSMWKLDHTYNYKRVFNATTPNRVWANEEMVLTLSIHALSPTSANFQIMFNYYGDKSLRKTMYYNEIPQIYVSKCLKIIIIKGKTIQLSPYKINEENVVGWKYNEGTIISISVPKQLMKNKIIQLQITANLLLIRQQTKQQNIHFLLYSSNNQGFTTLIYNKTMTSLQNINYQKTILKQFNSSLTIYTQKIIDTNITVTQFTINLSNPIISSPQFPSHIFLKRVAINFSLPLTLISLTFPTLSALPTLSYLTTLNNQTLLCSFGCLHCSQSQCQLCLNTFYLLNSQCLPCITNCLICTSSLNCSFCILGSYLLQSQCILCIAPCLQCTSNTCMVCIPGYTLSLNSCIKATNICLQMKVNDCVSCVKGYILMNNTCLSCIGNCSRCKEDLVTCTECNVGSRLVNQKTCIECSSNCIECQINVCSRCRYPYIVQDKQCVEQCQWPCAECKASTFCTSCFQNYDLINNKCVLLGDCNGTSSCNSCPMGSILNNKQCFQCNTIDKCIQCNSLNRSLCVLCVDGYYSSEGVCYPCQNSCLLCNNVLKCYLCTDGNYLSYQLDICLSCMSPCFTCLYGAYLCLQCIEGYVKIKNMCILMTNIQFQMIFSTVFQKFVTSTASFISLLAQTFQVQDPDKVIITEIVAGSTIVRGYVETKDSDIVIEILKKNIHNLQDKMGLTSYSTSVQKMTNENSTTSIIYAVICSIGCIILIGFIVKCILHIKTKVKIEHNFQLQNKKKFEMSPRTTQILNDYQKEQKGSDRAMQIKYIQA